MSNLGNRSFAGRPKNIALQERALAEAQKKLDRIEKMRAEMAKQVELEIQRLNDMLEVQEDFVSSPETTPSLGQSTGAAFQSQYDKFREVDSDTRLKSTNDSGEVARAIEAAGTLLTQATDTPMYRTSDRDQHWDTLTTDPGTAVYVSGYYYSSGAHTKHYEYQLGSTQLPLSVGDMVSAPVHYQGHGDGKFLAGHDRRFIVTDIYTNNKFTEYHDIIW